MIKKHIKYPKIVQFRNTVSDILRTYNYVGKDEGGEPIYDPLKPKPILTFKGTIKVHGTNASFSYNDQKGLWYQSRNGIISIENDNAGFAFFCEQREEVLQSMVDQVKRELNLDTSEYTITVYGEFAGKSIQKGVGVSELEKAFYIFGVKISKPQDGDFNAYWVDYTYLEDVESRIYNIDSFPTFEVEVDFNRPDIAQAKFVELTNQVEAECPVAAQLGVKEGVGEGLVWSCEYNDVVYRFKTKGEKHSTSKVKTIASVDVEKMNSIHEFVKYATTENRFKQALENVFPNDEPIDIRKLGDVIRWVVKDIMEEEKDVLLANNLEPKDVNKFISTEIRDMFKKALEF